jgi:hypothetical protein
VADETLAEIIQRIDDEKARQTRLQSAKVAADSVTTSASPSEPEPAMEFAEPSASAGSAVVPEHDEAMESDC